MTEKTHKDRIVIAITGASGAIFGITALRLLSDLPVETHLVVSAAGDRTITEETDLAPKDVRALADVVHNARDIGASIASGSFRARGMLVAPCSVRTMSEIAGGVTSSLVSRAADVMLKERRPLVLMVRETPLHTGHLRTMTSLSEMGAIIAPPVPGFYGRPESLDEMVRHSVGRALDLFQLNSPAVHRWTGRAPDR
ncbi:UbiX family flavin prenyltransferase [Yunchengibacter salinarum]|uniref:UbiX family flavin prenyltransferase n=1 Tax=Yunchengibacter salinarum TaxID=3133399 RepID=UPI0035B5EE52